MQEFCEVCIAIRFSEQCTRNRVRQEWVRVAEDPVKHIKRLARISKTDFWEIYNLLMSGAIYTLGNNQYKLCKVKKKYV